MGRGQRRGRVLEKQKGTIEMKRFDIEKLKAEIEARFNDNLEARKKVGLAFSVLPPRKTMISWH